MSVKIITSFATLFKLAKAVGDAKKFGTIEDVRSAEKAHEAYREICLSADEMSTGIAQEKLA